MWKKKKKETPEEKKFRKEQARLLRKKYPRHLAVRIGLSTFIVLAFVLGITGIINIGTFFVNGVFNFTETTIRISDGIRKTLEFIDPETLENYSAEEKHLLIQSAVIGIAEAGGEYVESVGVYYGDDESGFEKLVAIDNTEAGGRTVLIDPEKDPDVWKRLVDTYIQEEYSGPVYPVPNSIMEDAKRTDGSVGNDGKQLWASNFRIGNGEKYYLVLTCVDILEVVQQQLWYYLLFANLIFVVFLVVMVFTVLRTRKKVVKPLVMIGRAANEFVVRSEHSENPSDWTYDAPSIKSKDEIHALADFMVVMTDRIKTSVTELLSANSEKERISTELGLATRIQSSMLPNVFPPFPEHKEFSIYASMDPAKEVGGDFYDFFFIDETHLGLVIADVSDKGVPAALFMMSSMLIIRNIAKEGYSPAKLLERANNSIAASNTAEMFVTVWFGIFDTQTGLIQAANAGHEYPMVRSGGQDFAILKDRHGFVLGEMEGMKYREYEIELQHGDTIFVYTDGVPEASNEKEEFFGTGGLLKALNENPDGSPQELVTRVSKRLEEHNGDAPQFDDATMLCLKFY